MSVRTNQYIMYGIKLPFKKIFDEEVWSERTELYRDNGYKPEIKHYKGLSIVSDGMNGQWEFLGRIIAKSEIDQNLDGPYRFELCPPETAELIAALINTQFEELCSEQDIEASDIETYFFTHYH